MLTHLYIKNFAIIDELDIDFYGGFSVITGETGAGKSIILGALGLLLGTRADTRTIKEGTHRCVVEAQFRVEDKAFHELLSSNNIDVFVSECILRREININGKSRAFVNDTLVSLQELKEVSEQLVDIHSQHQNLLLKNNSFQLSVVDTIASNKELLASYRDAYQVYREALTEFETIQRELELNRQNIDYIRFQYEELSRLNLQLGEDDVLDQKSNIMQHTEDIKRALFEVDGNLSDEQSGILLRLHRSISSLSNILEVYSQGKDVVDRLDNAYVEMKEVSSDVANLLDEVDYDPDEMERINSRLDAIYSIEKKHNVSTIADLLALQEKFKAEIELSDNSSVVIEDLEKKVNQARQQCLKLAQQLSSKRRASINKIEEDMAHRMEKLGLAGVMFKVNITAKEPSADGIDRVEFLFSANSGVPLRAISEVASGGEISRVMFALKSMLSGRLNLPTIIFDEIDTGVSGKIAEQMAITMREMSNASRQVISITHLPQIAACGTTHYRVYKLQDEGETKTKIKLLTQDERVEEIAQMLSGNNVSEAAVSNAKELLGRQEDILILT